MKGWTCQGSLIWHQHEIMRKKGPIRALVSFTLQRNLCASVLFVEASLCRLTGWFHIHLFYIYLSYSEDLAIQTSSECNITRRQRPIRAFVLFTLQRKLCTNMHRTQLLGYSSGCSGRLAVHHLAIKHLNLCKFIDKIA